MRGTRNPRQSVRPPGETLHQLLLADRAHTIATVAYRLAEVGTLSFDEVVGMVTP